MKVSSLSDRWNLHNLPDHPADGPVLCSDDVLSGVGSGVVSEILNMFNIPDTTTDIKCSHDGTVRRTVRRTVLSCEHHIKVLTYGRGRPSRKLTMCVCACVCVCVCLCIGLVNALREFTNLSSLLDLRFHSAKAATNLSRGRSSKAYMQSIRVPECMYTYKWTRLWLRVGRRLICARQAHSLLLS